MTPEARGSEQAAETEVRQEYLQITVEDSSSKVLARDAYRQSRD